MDFFLTLETELKGVLKQNSYSSPVSFSCERKGTLALSGFRRGFKKGEEKERDALFFALKEKVVVSASMSIDLEKGKLIFTPLSSTLKIILANPKLAFFLKPTSRKEKIVVDFFSPNVI